MMKHFFAALVVLAAFTACGGGGGKLKDGGTVGGACGSPPCFTISVAVLNAGGEGMVLTTGLEPNLTVPAQYAGPLVFANELSSGTAYAVSIVSQPPSTGATCTVATSGANEGTGTINNANVVVDVSCAIQLP